LNLVATGQFTVFKQPLGFIKVLQWFFAIFAFSTCGGYSGVLRLSVECKNRSESDLNIEVEFDYPFRLHQVWFDAPTCKGPEPERLFLEGDNSSSAEFFVTIGVFSFLYSMAAISVYIFLVEKYREGNRGAFGFCNVVLWAGNLWFVLKETGWLAAFAGTYMPSGEKQPAPDSSGQEGYGQDPYASSQSGYQPDYSQQGGGYEGGGYNQYGQGEPTSFSNEM
uniref:Synaptophysin b n=1 Tax=Sinocyclocheilus grahami TaxID=75366 RepID=A0A672JWT1_SINGR